MKQMHQANIDWTYGGKVDLSVGPGATSSERVLMWMGALVLLAWLIIVANAQSVSWAWWQWAVAAIVAIDIGGGAVANALNSCKRFYHSPVAAGDGVLGRLVKNHLLFAGLHLHTIVVALVFAPAAIGIAAVWYVSLVAAVVLTLLAPLYLHRPIATLCVMCAVLAGTQAELGIPHFEWLGPLLFVKIVLGHAVREEPYRPS